MPDVGPISASRGLVRAGPLALLAALPALVSAVLLLFSLNGRFLPHGDHAILQLSVRQVGREPVLLGSYSRFGFYHPGPLAAYLLAVPYRLLGGAYESLSIGALLINAASLAGIAAVLRRRLGRATALWGMTVLAVTLRTLEPGLLRDSWNPLLPVLPFLLLVLLGWTALRGDAWALPLAVLPASLAVQSHVGYLAPVAAVAGVVCIGLFLRVRRLGPRAAVRCPGARRRVAALLASAGVATLLWTPPIIQQLTGEPGNVGQILLYLRGGESHSSLAIGLRSILDEFARLPSYVLGVDPPDNPVLPHGWPVWAGATGLASFAGAVALAAWRRRPDLLWLSALTVAVAGAGVAAVARIEGLRYLYITRWAAAVGVLAWVTVGAAALSELYPWLRRAAERRPRLQRAPGAITAGLTLLAVVTTGILTVSTARSDTPHTDQRGHLSRLVEAVDTDLRNTGMVRADGTTETVRVDFADRGDLIGVFFDGWGVALGLIDNGVDVQLSPHWELAFGRRFVERAYEARYVATISYADGSPPQPEPGQRLLAVSGLYQVYAGPVPTSPTTGQP